MIELLYFASQIQCGANTELLDVKVDVYKNQELVQTMSVNDKVLLDVNSIKDLSFEYHLAESNCVAAIPTEKLLGSTDPLPNLAGAYEQQSIQDMQDDLASYEELWLVELGTTNTSSVYFDLQDVILKVNNNPESLPPSLTTNMFAD